MSDTPSPFTLLVAYGSQTGNAEYLAEELTDALGAVGIETDEVELNDVEPAQLQDVSHFVVLCSTTGDGEVPDNATVFWEALSADDADRLEHLNVAVLSLGDPSYTDFANGGKIVEERLLELGATALTDRVDVDEDYEDDAGAWTERVVEIVAAARDAAGAPPAAPAPVAAPEHADERSPWTRKNPYTARLAVNRLLTAPESDKEVRHYEIDLGDSGLTYHPGDAVGVHPVNDPALVDAILARLGVPAETVPAGRTVSLGELLSEHLEIRTPSRDLRALVAEHTDDAEARSILAEGDAAAQETWLYGRDVLDLLELADDLPFEAVLETLRPLQFRDYSIASSPLRHPGQLHVTVSSVRHADRDRERGGVASTFLADRAEKTGVKIHLQPNHVFRLPADDVPIIMVGPGTGIAPFRAFLQEREATGAPGRSWLFFGDRRRATDYLYGEELEGFVAAGVLTRLDLAFSRDQAEKDYVQHRMLENADELFSWLSDGAYFYVCGDADHMAKDVDAALHRIIETAGGLDPDAAHAYVNELIKAHRYVRDVY